MTDEILVHISAPNTRHNTDLYRSLADAYLDFEPRTVAKLDHQNASSFQVTPANVSIVSLSKDSYGSFPSNISSGNQSRVDERQLTPLLDDETAAGEPVISSTVSRLAQLERIHTAWQDQRSLRSSATHEQYKNLQATMDNTDTTFIQDSQQAAYALQSQLVESFMTTSECASDGEGSTANDNRVTESLGSSSEKLGPVALGADGELLASASHSGSPITLFGGFSGHTESNTAIPMQHPAVESRSPKHMEDTTLALQVTDFGDLASDVYPPAPPISIECPLKLPPQITTHLEAIKRQNPTEFRPTKKVRTPALDERGYWVLDCESWPPSLQRDCWSYLCEQVRSGRLGWGVTLHRVSACSHSLGQMRLYCWGEVLEHMWLSIWLGSEGKVSGSGSQWVDAEDTVVIEVL